MLFSRAYVCIIFVPGVHHAFCLLVCVCLSVLFRVSIFLFTLWFVCVCVCACHIRTWVNKTEPVNILWPYSRMCLFRHSCVCITRVSCLYIYMFMRNCAYICIVYLRSWLCLCLTYFSILSWNMTKTKTRLHSSWNKGTSLRWLMHRALNVGCNPVEFPKYRIRLDISFSGRLTFGNMQLRTLFSFDFSFSFPRFNFWFLSLDSFPIGCEISVDWKRDIGGLVRGNERRKWGKGEWNMKPLQV